MPAVTSLHRGRPSRARTFGSLPARAWRAASERLEGRTLLSSYAFTTNADFDAGILSAGVNHLVADQLQLNKTTTPYPFVSVAASARGTMVRINVNTGQVLGEFLSAPNGMGRDPSRTTVDLKGNVWLSNRAEGGGGRGSVTRVALAVGGTRGVKNADGSFTPDPVGGYLQGPFDYLSMPMAMVDRDADGLIRKSRGLGDILPWTNAGSADANGDTRLADGSIDRGVTTAHELIINYTRIAGTNARTVAVDRNNDLWTGGLGDLDHEKVDGVTGVPIPGTQFNRGAGGYGGPDRPQRRPMVRARRRRAAPLRHEPARHRPDGIPRVPRIPR